MGPQWYRALDNNSGRAFWTSFGGFALDSLDIQLYAFVLPVLLTVWKLSHAEAGFLVTAALASSAVGGWIAGLLADRFGRVRILKFTILWFAISTCLCGLAQSFDQLLMARILQGLGFGGEIAIGAVFVGEVAPARLRGRMVGFAQSGWAIGWGVAAIVSLSVFSLFPPEIGWRVVFFIGLLPAVLLFIFRNKLKEPTLFRRPDRPVPWSGIFSRPLLGSTIKGSLLAAGMHSGYWAIATWWPTMLLADRGLSMIDSGPYLAAMIAGSFFGYIVGAWIGDRVGRRYTLMLFSLGGIALALTYPQISASGPSFILLSFPLGFVATGMFGIISSILIELYPTELRGSGLGFCYNFGRGIAGFAPALIGTGAALLGVGYAIALLVIAAYGLVLLTALFLPETQGSRLEFSKLAPRSLG
jgi:MFS family permease